MAQMKQKKVLALFVSLGLAAGLGMSTQVYAASEKLYTNDGSKAIVMEP